MPMDAQASRLARNVSLTYGAIFTVYGLQLPYLGVLLESRGLTAEEIGIAVAVPALLRLVVNPAIAAWADARAQHGRMLILLCCTGVVGAIALGPAQGLLLLTLAVTVLMLPLQSAMPFVEVIAMRGVRRHGLDYGRLRLWGSLTFILATVGGGAALERFGADALPPLLILAAALCVASSLALVSGEHASESLDAGGQAARGAPSRGGFVEQVSAVMSVPGLAAFLLGAAAVQASHAVYYAFSALHWTGQGISGEIIGLLWAVGVIAEIALFAVSGRFVALFGPVGLLALGAVAGILRWVAMAFDPSLIWLWPLQILHGLTFGATHLAAIHFIALRVPTDRAGMAQSLFATFSTGVVMAGALYAAGVLYGAVAATSYVGMAAFAGAGLLAALVSLRSAPDPGRVA